MYLSVHWILTGAIFQIYVPQIHGVLNHESDSPNEFPPTARLPVRQKTINPTDGQWKFMKEKNLDQVTETSFAFSLDFTRNKSSQGFPLFGPTKSLSYSLR